MTPDLLTHAAFEQAPYGMFVAHMDGEIVAINRAMRGLLRQPAEQTGGGLSLPALLANPDDVLDVLQLLYDAGRFDDLDLSFRCGDGTAQTLRLSASTLPADGSGPKCFLGTAPVSSKPSADNDPIRTSRMHAVERLAAAVAHDLNNVLSAVVGYCHLLREPLQTNRQALQDLMAIEQSSDRAAAVVRQLLVFGRKRILEPDVLEVGLQVTMLEPILRRILPPETALVLGAMDQQARIVIDHVVFNEILILLLSARNTTTERGEVTISSSATDDGRLAIDIIDADPDLEVPDIEKCVDELFASPESAGGYSGLGLAAVQVLIARSGGTISVDNTPGGGTLFRLTFPMVDADDHRATGIEVSSGMPAMGVGTVMIVDDDPALREIARRVLGDEGYMVVEARSGEEALALANEPDRSFDVLVTDMMMPGIKGWEVGRAVKAKHPRCAMIYVSGYIDSARLRQELPDDAVFIGKPFTPPKLLEAVATAVGRTAS